MRRVPSPYGVMPDSYGMFLASVFLRGPNRLPKPIAIKAIAVANTTINAIATYSSMLTPQNARCGREFVRSCTTFGEVYHKRLLRASESATFHKNGDFCHIEKKDGDLKNLSDQLVALAYPK
jgi:hypothetical protein